MKIFYDEVYGTYDVPVGNTGTYYSTRIWLKRWDRISEYDGLVIGTRQVPDTVLVLVGAPELEYERCR
jgi:hypothetical protein